MLTVINYYFLPVLVVTSVIFIMIYLINCIRHKKYAFIRYFIIYVFLGVIISILFVTCISTLIIQIAYTGSIHIVSYNQINLIPFDWLINPYGMGVKKMIVQLLLNVIMMIPFGILLPIIYENMKKWWKTMLTAMVFIAVIEIIQFFIGRSADIDDWIMNVTGAMIGYGIFIFFERRLCLKKWWNKMIGDEERQIS